MQTAVPIRKGVVVDFRSMKAWVPGLIPVETEVVVEEVGGAPACCGGAGGAARSGPPGPDR